MIVASFGCIEPLLAMIMDISLAAMQATMTQ